MSIILLIFLLILIAAFLGNVLIPYTMRYYFYKLNQLQRIFFNIYLKQDYQENHFFYEKKIYYINQQLLASSGHHPMLDDLYELVVSLGNLRFRMQDMATLAMLANEMRSVQSALTELFQSQGKKPSVLQESIHHLENSFSGTVYAAAVDPVVILLFIQNLKEIDLYVTNANN